MPWVAWHSVPRRPCSLAVLSGCATGYASALLSVKHVVSALAWPVAHQSFGKPRNKTRPGEIP